MKYMLLIHQGDTPQPGTPEWEPLSAEEQQAVYRDYQAINETPGVTPGVWLQPPETATTVRVKDGETPGRGERFGWPPSDDEDESGRDFKARVHAFARRMDEERGLQRNIGPRAKDYGLDVVAWRGIWHDITTKGALPLDRLRLAALLEDTDFGDELLLAVREWVGEVVPTLPFLEAA